MSTMTLSKSSRIAPLRAKSGWIIALGVVYIVGGIIAHSSVVMATAASVLIVGIMMIIAGVAWRAAHRMRTRGVLTEEAVSSPPKGISVPLV